jgi:hypothetical protein
MGKMVLHKFDPVIYPYKIWICISSDPQAVLDEYFNDYVNGSKIDVEDPKDFEGYTFSVRRKGSGMFGTVIIFASRKCMTVKTISHEASHAAKDVFNHIGADVAPHEPFEYLLGWIADCCQKVKLSKA